MKTITLDSIAIIKIQGHLAVAIRRLEEIYDNSHPLLQSMREWEEAELTSLLEQLQEADKNGRSVY